MSRKKKNSKQRSNRLKRMGKRLAAYSAAAAATVVASQDRAANAAPLIYDIPDVTVGTEPGRLFNVITGATAVPGASAGNAVQGSFRIASYLGTSPYIAGPASRHPGWVRGSGRLCRRCQHRCKQS